MTDRPQELGIGIAKGASSFVKKSVFGFSDSMAKFTGSMSKGLAAATMDKEYQDQRRMSKSRNRPKHALYGVTSGGNAFASSMASGIGGLARHPIEGAEKEGLGGFVKGVGKGVLGLPIKAGIGAFDLASSKFIHPCPFERSLTLLLYRSRRRRSEHHHSLRRRGP
jgi:vacuolar protein sorting-associated protein 13A/C